MKIGYIGLGALGSELARRFLPQHELCVWDMRDDAVKRFTALGACGASSPAQLAQSSDVVLLCLPRSSDVRQAIFGEQGLAEGLAPGKLIIDQTSGIPRETAAIARELASRGVAMMDAAVSASPHVVPQGGATLMAGAADDTYARALPVLRAITETVYRCGSRVGDGQAMKMVNNAMNAGCRMGTLELVALGRKAGISMAQLIEVLNRGNARNQTTEKMLPAIAQGKSSTNFGLSLMLKDINQAVSLGMEVGVPMPITNVVRGLLQIGANTLGSHALLEDMIGVIERMAETRIGSDNGGSTVVGIDPLSAQPLKDVPRGSAVGVDELDAVPGLVDEALESLCLLVTFECVAAGFKFGLSLEDMSIVLSRGSGWSAASQKLLPLLASGQPLPFVDVQKRLLNLRRASDIAIRCGVPMLISMIVRNLLEAGVNQCDPGSGCAPLAQSLYEAMSSISFVGPDTHRTSALVA